MAPTLLVLEAFPTNIFQIKGRVSLIENRRCGYTCCACYSLKSYSLAETPRKIPLHSIRTNKAKMSGIRKRKRRSIASFSNRFQYYSSTENSSPSIDSTSSIGIFAPSCMVIRRSKSSIFLTAPTADTYFPPAFRSSGRK